MKDCSVDNKRILKNTIFLYVRMIFLMVISLYTVRVTLKNLGVENYGIYNVVGGVVALFSFLRSALTSSSQRFFSIHLAKGNMEALNKQFCLNLNVFLLIVVIVILLLETGGLWFLNCKMSVSSNRLFAANVVFQLSIISFVMHMLTVPYNAMIVAYEKMGAFAYISIVEGLLKLAIAYVLLVVYGDKLIVYGLLTLLYSAFITGCYIVYCKRKLQGTDYFWYWNTSEVKNLFAFTGWHFLGTTSVSAKTQGVNMLINIFFNPAVNAARAVAMHVDLAVLQLSNNFFTAVKPQMYKTYANNEMDALYNLVFRSTIFCAFLMSLFSIPLIISADYILSLWLHEVPEYTVVFTQLVLINGIIDSTNGATIAPALATGKIKKYMIIVSLIIFANIPLCYLFLVNGYSPTVTMYISIFLSIITMFVRAFLLKKLIGLPLKKYYRIATLIILSTLFMLIILHYIFINGVTGMLGLFICLFVSILMQTIIYSGLIVNKDDRQAIIKIVLSKIKK